MGYFLPFYPPINLKKSKFQKNEKKKNAWRYHHFTHVHQRRWLDEVWFLRYGTIGMRQTDGWTDRQKRWHIEVGAPPKKINISNRVQLSLGWKKRKKENCKSNSLIQTLVYRSNIYYSKIYQRGNWKNNSSTLHLEVWTRYFRHRDTQLNSVELQWI